LAQWGGTTAAALGAEVAARSAHLAGLANGERLAFEAVHARLMAFNP
jgi:hypothetical protein